MAQGKGLPPELGWLWVFNALLFGAAAVAVGGGMNRLLLGLLALGWLVWGGGLLAQGRGAQARRWATWGLWLTLGSALALVVWQVLRLSLRG